MCLAIPGKILNIDASLAKVNFGHGVVRDVDISLVDVIVGQYVLVHTGYAIQVLDEEDAKASLSLWKELLDSLDEV